MYKEGLINLMQNQYYFYHNIKSVAAMVKSPIVTIILIYLKNNSFLYRKTVPILDHTNKLLHKIKKRHTFLTITYTPVAVGLFLKCR